jgi:hypothetical protein
LVWTEQRIVAGLEAIADTERDCPADWDLLLRDLLREEKKSWSLMIRRPGDDQFAKLLLLLKDDAHT